MCKLRVIVGRPAGRRATWAVLVFWLIIVAVAGPLVGKLPGAEKNDASAWLPAQAEPTKVLNLQARFQSPNIFTAVVVYDRPSGPASADRAKAAADASRFPGVAGVVRGQVAGPFAARDGKAIETIGPVSLGSKGWNGASAAATTLRGIARAHANGLTSHIAGPLGSAADSANSFKGIDGTLLAATLIVVITLLLLVTYRSPVLWLLPVLSAGVTLTSAAALISLLARYAGLTVNAQSAGILYVLVFGAGTGYALLLTSRYGKEQRRHSDRHEAMAIALRRAGPAIIASAGTVILSRLTLSAAELNSTKSLGPVVAIGVAVALVAMMTLLPALMVIPGRWMFWPVKPTFGSAEPTTRRLRAGVGQRIAIRPRTLPPRTRPPDEVHIPAPWRLERIGASRVSSAAPDNLAKLKELPGTGHVRLQDGRAETVSSQGKDHVMKYRHVVVRRTGGPEVLQIAEDELPAPISGRALVKILAADVGFSDVNIRRGRYPGGPRPPFTPGYAIADVVDRLGPANTDT